MRGDLLFYTPKDWIGSLVAWATNGPFCHVAVDTGHGTKIEADSNGIVRVSQDDSQGDTRFDDALYRTILRLGHDGWELAAFPTTGGWNVPQQVSMFFKRPMPSADAGN